MGNKKEDEKVKVRIRLYNPIIRRNDWTDVWVDEKKVKKVKRYE